ncbi:SDR family NAD(P)-dependent oxidoreductase [uncultured Jatrophihabitans sp.]|uniref:SDR family NAD(P)-dependent oxidoreductase n=1 Tax=uncultured Jatrophihabitans sp. TaxID=1610747 RepID=UPI0035CA8B66
MEISGAHVLVVGATGGLGSALARALAADGARLSLSGRDATRLSALADELTASVLSSVSADLVDPSAPARIVDAAVAASPLDVVVFAAGVVAFGAVAELDDDTLDQLLLVNVIAPVRLLRAVAPQLGRGAVVVNLSAVVAETPLPGMAAYAASKAALTAFDRAAGRELRRAGVRVLDVRPPHTETGLASRPVAGISPRLGAGKSPDEVAARIVQALRDDEADLPSDAF